jgi:hypothetical protein
MSSEIPDPSIVFGETEGLSVYRAARSLDGDSSISDQPIPVLARDAINTALRYVSEDDPDLASQIDAEIATNGLIRALEKDFQNLA